MLCGKKLPSHFYVNTLFCSAFCRKKYYTIRKGRSKPEKALNELKGVNNEAGDMKQKNRSFIVYLDDNDEKKEAFVEVIKSNTSFIKFATNKNIITIPFSRIIKLKEDKFPEGK